MEGSRILDQIPDLIQIPPLSDLATIQGNQPHRIGRSLKVFHKMLIRCSLMINRNHLHAAISLCLMKGGVHDLTHVGLNGVAGAPCRAMEVVHHHTGVYLDCLIGEHWTSISLRHFRLLDPVALG